MLNIGLSEIKKIEKVVNSGKDYISLSQGALKVGGIPTEIKKHLQEILNTDRTDYYQSAWGITLLREKIAQNLRNSWNVKILPENVLVTHGCMGAISVLLLTLLERGQEVILPEPTYPAYKNIVGVSRGKPVFVSWDSDIEKIKNAKTNLTKVIILSNPCNPTGKILSKKDLKDLIEWCEKNKIYLIVDEAYDDYIFDGNFESATQFVPQSDFIIRTGSYSKSLSMSGWRVGFMVVPKSLSDFMGITQDAVLNCPNVIAQHAVLYALDHPEHWKNFHNIVRESRDIAVEKLQPLADKNIISFKKPEAGFYLFFKTKHEDSFNLCEKILNSAKVGLIPGRAFGPSGASFIRLCYARKSEIVVEGIERIKKVLDV